MSRTLIIGLIFASASDAQGVDIPAKTEKKLDIACILVIKKSVVPVGITPDAEVHLKNDSKAPITITFMSNIFSSLDIEILDPDGKKINKYRYGSLFGPNSRETKLTLKPGDSYSHPVVLSPTCKEVGFNRPGVYRITAIFDNKTNIRAVSKTVEIKFVEE